MSLLSDRIPRPSGQYSQEEMAKIFSAIENMLNSSQQLFLSKPATVGSATSTYNMNLDDGVVLVNRTTTGTCTVNLPSAAYLSGRFRTIKDSGNGAATYTITVSAIAGQTIDGSTTKTITTNHGSIRVYSDGANWYLV